MRLWRDLDSELDKLKSRDLFRSLRPVPHAGTSSDFSSNDYLGLASHPKVVRSALSAAKEWGTGSGASRLLSGNLGIHEKLEQKLARFKNEGAATVFSSGYLANLGVLSALANEKDVIFLDRLDHASLFDGARLSRAKWRVYPHLDGTALERLLSRAAGFRRRFVVTDAYFSMDGDMAPLKDLAEVCRRQDAVLVVDEAHSTGVFGKTGRGLTEHFHLEGKIPVVMGTLSKALGSVGGFIAGQRALKETLHNACRPFIYTTAPSPMASAAALAALELIEKDGAFRKKLWENTEFLRGALLEAGFDLMRSEGPIIPILTGSTEKTLRVKEALFKKSFAVSAIRPPTVPRGTDRLRLSVSASHERPAMLSLVRELKRAWK